MKKENPKISAVLRTVTGRAVKNLRLQGLTPSTIYGHKFEPLSIQFSAAEIEKLFNTVGESTLVEIVIDGETYPVLFKNPQYHPISSNLVHLDCHKVNLKEKIIASVPVELIGEAPATKDGNTLMHILNEVEVEALPANLPEKIEVDISGLIEIDNKITVADLILDRDLIEIKNAPDQVVCLIEAPRVEEEPVVEAEATPVDVPATAQKTEEEKAAKAAEEAAEKSDK